MEILINATTRLEEIKKEFNKHFPFLKMYPPGQLHPSHKATNLIEFILL